MHFLNPGLIQCDNWQIHVGQSLSEWRTMAWMKDKVPTVKFGLLTFAHFILSVLSDKRWNFMFLLKILLLKNVLGVCCNIFSYEHFSYSYQSKNVCKTGEEFEFCTTSPSPSASTAWHIEEMFKVGCKNY